MLRSLSTSAFALIVAAGPALAEVTPVEVWDDIVNYYSQFGYSITEGARDDAGDSLTITDVVMSVDGIEDTGGDVSLQIPKVLLTTTGGGDVRTVFEGDMAGTISAMGPDAEPVEITFTATAPGNEMVTTGAVGDMSHALTYPSLTLTTEIPGEGGATAPVEIEVTNTTGNYTTKSGDAGGQLTYDTTSEAATITLNADRPAEAEGGPSNLALTMAMNTVNVTGAGTLPRERFNLNAQMADALRAGLKLDGTIGYASLTGNIDFSGRNDEGADTNGKGEFNSDAGVLNFTVDQAGIQYGGEAGKTAVSLTSSDLPFPISYATGSASFGLTMPMLKSETDQPYALSYALNELTLGDEIWALFDPNAQLPRDPASLTVDLAGQTKVTRDIMDPEFQRRMMAATAPTDGDAPMTPEQQAEFEALTAEAMPFALSSLTVNKVALDAVGAKADLSGELTVPEGGSLQEPLGEVNGTFTGINGLIDTLVAMGLVPQDQVMGARMMMMMFARPVEGQPDTLSTKLEFKEGGEILANGQKVK